MKRHWGLRTAGTVVSLFFAGAMLCASATPALAADQTAKDPKGKTVRIPDAVATKLKDKHNLKIATVKTWLPKSATTFTKGTRKEYVKGLTKIECAANILGVVKCRNTGEKVNLLFVVDFRIDSTTNKQVGLVTAYCDGYYYRCPSWVNSEPIDLKHPTTATGPMGTSGSGGGGGSGGSW